MKLLLCHNYYQQPGGESEVFENEIRGLRQMGTQVVLYTRHNADIDLLSAPRRLGLIVSAYHSRRSVRELEDLVRHERPDAAIVQNVFPLISPSAYATLTRLGVPSIQAVYNYRFICPSGSLYTEGRICERCVPGNTIHAVIHRCYRKSYMQSAWYASIIALHRWRRTFADRIGSYMVPDEFLGAKLVQGGIPADRVWRNPNPFFVEDYEPRNEHRGYVLFAGRLLQQKGVLTLLRAIERTSLGSRAVIVGDGPLEPEIRRRLASAELVNRVICMGPRWNAELDHLIQDCAAVVIPSEWYDNLPMMLCKANALGKPVIASRLDGLQEYVVPGVNGYLFKTGEAAELGGFIDDVLALSASDYSNLSRTARDFADATFNYPIHYRKLMQHVRGQSLHGVHGEPTL